MKRKEGRRSGEEGDWDLDKYTSCLGGGEKPAREGGLWGSQADAVADERQVRESAAETRKVRELGVLGLKA